MADTDEVRGALRAWITERAKGLDADGLTDTTPLFEGRHLTSMQVPDLILLIERLTGRFVDVTALQPGDFRDIDSIVGRFVDGDGSGSRGSDGSGRP